MAEQNELASARGHVKRSRSRGSQPQSGNGGQAAPVPARPEGAQAVRGRKAGKRSDPAYRPTTFFVRKETQRKAVRLLEDQDAGKDLSDLVEELLAKWVVDNSHV